MIHCLPVLNDGLLCRQRAEAARARLRASPYRVFAAVSCACDRGVLLLQGRVSSFFHKQLAQETVARLEGVTRVVNEIGVAASEWRRG